MFPCLRRFLLSLVVIVGILVFPKGDDPTNVVTDFVKKTTSEVSSGDSSEDGVSNVVSDDSSLDDVSDDSSGGVVSDGDVASDDSDIGFVDQLSETDSHFPVFGRFLDVFDLVIRYLPSFRVESHGRVSDHIAEYRYLDLLDKGNVLPYMAVLWPWQSVAKQERLLAYQESRQKLSHYRESRENSDCKSSQQSDRRNESVDQDSPEKSACIVPRVKPATKVKLDSDSERIVPVDDYDDLNLVYGKTVCDLSLVKSCALCQEICGRVRSFMSLDSVVNASDENDALRTLGDDNIENDFTARDIDSIVSGDDVIGNDNQNGTLNLVEFRSPGDQNGSEFQSETAGAGISAEFRANTLDSALESGLKDPFDTSRPEGTSRLVKDPFDTSILGRIIRENVQLQVESFVSHGKYNQHVREWEQKVQQLSQRETSEATSQEPISQGAASHRTLLALENFFEKNKPLEISRLSVRY